MMRALFDRLTGRTALRKQAVASHSALIYNGEARFREGLRKGRESQQQYIRQLQAQIVQHAQDLAEATDLLKRTQPELAESRLWEKRYNEQTEVASRAIAAHAQSNQDLAEANADKQRLHDELAGLKDKFRPENFPKHQATECGKCGVRKHTPWRDDYHGFGYVCATCLVSIYDEEASVSENTRRQFLLELRSDLRTPAPAENRIECVVAKINRATGLTFKGGKDHMNTSEGKPRTAEGPSPLADSSTLGDSALSGTAAKDEDEFASHPIIKAALDKFRAEMDSVDPTAAQQDAVERAFNESHPLPVATEAGAVEREKLSGELAV